MASCRRRSWPAAPRPRPSAMDTSAAAGSLLHAGARASASSSFSRAQPSLLLLLPRTAAADAFEERGDAIGTLPHPLPSLLEVFSAIHSSEREAKMHCPPAVGLSLNINIARYAGRFPVCNFWEVSEALLDASRIRQVNGIEEHTTKSARTTSRTAPHRTKKAKWTEWKSARRRQWMSVGRDHSVRMVSRASMAAALDDVGRVSNLLQLLGVDALGLVSMITQAALTARRNRDLCLQLAEHGRVVAGLLRVLRRRLPQLRRHPETRRPLEQLDDALSRAYLLVRSCGQEIELRSYFYQLITGAHTAAKLRAAEEEIDRYIRLIPMIGLVATDRGLVVGAEDVQEEDGEDSALAQRDDVASLVDGETLSHEQVAPVQSRDALPQASVVTAMADNLRELTIQEGAEASSHVFSPEAQVVHAAEASASTSGTKNRRDKRKKNWRAFRVSPQPIIKKAKRRKDIICYVCVVPRHAAGSCCNNKGEVRSRRPRGSCLLLPESKE